MAGRRDDRPPAQTPSAIPGGTPQRRGMSGFVSTKEEAKIMLQLRHYYWLTNSVENVAGSERQGETGVHRVLLRTTKNVVSPKTLHQTCQPDFDNDSRALTLSFYFDQ
jgi:hypothetical protein